MRSWFPLRRHERVTTRVGAVVRSGGVELPVSVTSLSEGGFYCRGHELEGVEDSFEIRLRLESAGPDWSPRPGEPGWISPRRQRAQVEVEASAALLYVDFQDDQEGGRVGLGARFEHLGEVARAAIREYVQDEIFRVRGWRTAGGGVPMPGLRSTRSRGLTT
ncbi:MAG: PilZ domain-containing protein [Acidobacteriota bacterium]